MQVFGVQFYCVWTFFKVLNLVCIETSNKVLYYKFVLFNHIEYNQIYNIKIVFNWKILKFI